MSYATPAEYRARFGIPDDTTNAKYANARIQPALDLASTRIDRFTGRHFMAQSSDEHRFIYDGSPFLIPDFSSITAIDPSGTAARQKRTPPDWPYNMVRFDRDSCPALGEVVTITGRQGWATVPAGIQQATIELAALWLLDGDRTHNQISLGETVQNLTREARSLLQETIADFKRNTYYIAEEA